MGISVNWVDNKNRTPLHLAAKLGDSELADLLIRLGTDPNAVDYKGRSPAAIAENKGNTHFVNTVTSMGGKIIRLIAGNEEFKTSTDTVQDRKSLSGVARLVTSTVDNTHKLYKDLKKTSKILDSAKFLVSNKTIS